MAIPILVSHALCPYVQRAAIVLAEKQVAFERRDIDLANKPDWFLKISPLGKTPVLIVDQHAIFESAVILEYLEDTQPNPLHPSDPLMRAQHRGWVEFGSAILNDIAGLYNAADQAAFQAKADALAAKFGRIEGDLDDGPWFAGADFCVVDAVFAPVFRYFDVLDTIDDFGVLHGLPRVQEWRVRLSRRPSVRHAVSAQYPDLLRTFFENRKSHLSSLIENSAVPA